jgi:hypothetical protein
MIHYALHLSVEKTALVGIHERHHGGGLIEMHEKKQFTEEVRALACLYATYLMGWSTEKTQREQQLIAKAASTIVCYDLGYKKRTGKYMLDKWLNDVREPVNTTVGLLKNKHKGKISQTMAFEAEYPTYLHQLYRRSTAILDDDATFSEVASQMNLLSTVDPLPTMHLNKWSLLHWFKKNKGKEQQAKLTTNHKQAQIQYINKIHTLQEEGYLDEAWNYLWSRRKKMKHLPRADFEEEGIDRVCVRRVLSRTNPVNTIFMGVVFPPNPEHNFDGKIAIKRISRSRQLLCNT